MPFRSFSVTCFIHLERIAFPLDCSVQMLQKINICKLFAVQALNINNVIVVHSSMHNNNLKVNTRFVYLDKFFCNRINIMFPLKPKRDNPSLVRSAGQEP